MRSILEQLGILEKIKDEGQIVLIKFDGERSSDKITVLIDYPQPTVHKQIRYNGDNLNVLLEKIIDDYYSSN